MSSLREGGLVTVTEGEGRTLDGIVFQIAGPHKLVVAVPDPARGAVLRTFPEAAGTEREGPRPGDPALERLIRRTPATPRGGRHAGGAGGHRPGGHAPRRGHPPAGQERA